MQYLILLLIIAVLIYFVWPVALAAVVLYVGYRLIRYIRKERYFRSDKFLARKAELSAIVAEHNDIASYVAEMRASESFVLAKATSGSGAYLATTENTSRHNYRRDRNVADFASTNVHNCSLQVVRNAKADPLKYLTKYFNVNADELTLTEVEALGESLSRIEAAVENLRAREAGISQSFAPPAFILKHYRTQFMEHVGVELSPVVVPYPEYAFEYVSAGGNSSQRTTIRLDTERIDALAEYLAERIRYRRSAAGQRALMTTKLREFIKVRDQHTCRYCGVSLAAEPHLLLEVDHIVPVSRGGLSVVENLQTLCWRCNRTKSNKAPV